MLERINPSTADSVSLTDHYSRYFFASHFVKGKRVLDAACGTGYGAYFLKKMGAAVVTGIDISSDAIQLAKSSYMGNGLEFICGDLKNVGEIIEEYRYDIVVSFETIEHIANPEIFIAGIAKVLQKDGLFISSVPDDIGNKIENPFHVNRFTREDYHKLLHNDFRYLEAFTQHLSLGVQISRGTELHFPSESLEIQSGVWVDRLPLIPHRDKANASAEIVFIERPVADIRKFCFLAVCSPSSLDHISFPQSLAHSVSAWHEYSSMVKRYETDLLTEIKSLREECDRLHNVISALDKTRVTDYQNFLNKITENEKSYIEREKILSDQIKELTVRLMVCGKK